MKIKNALMCGAMAAVMLLAGCGKDGSSSKDEPTSSGVSAPGGILSSDFKGNAEDVSPEKGDLIATFEIEGYGTIKAVLFPEAAPVGVENFQKLCDAGYYEGLKIHRVVAGFMFQGGSLNGNGTGGDAMVNGGKFSIETAQNARHFYGALCYANAGVNNNTSQFYIVNNKTPQDLNSLAVNIQSYADQYKELAAVYREQGIDNAVKQCEEQANYYQLMADWMTIYATDEIRSRYMEKGGTPTLDGNYTVFGQVYEGFDVIDAISAAEVVDNGGGEVSKPVKDIIIKNISVSTFD